MTNLSLLSQDITTESVDKSDKFNQSINQTSKYILVVYIHKVLSSEIGGSRWDKAWQINYRLLEQYKLWAIPSPAD